MSTTLKASLLGLLAVLQIGVTAWSMVKYESVLRTGTLYRIPSAPVDPADPFRGRYVAVRPSIRVSHPAPPDMLEAIGRIGDGEPGFVVLATDDKGFARAAQVLTEPPAQRDYLPIAHVAPQFQQSADTLPTPLGFDLIFAFDRYYMNDATAPHAERRAAEAARANAESRTWLTVRVKNGVGVIEGMFVDGVPIEQAVR